MKQGMKFVAAAMVCCLMLELLPQSLLAQEASTNPIQREVPREAESISENEVRLVSENSSENIQLKVYSNGLLTIEGEGDYYNTELNNESSYDNSVYNQFLSDYRDDITSIRVKVSGITSTYRMFAGFKNVTAIDLTEFDTSNVRNMEYMFYEFGYNELKSLDLTGLDTQNAAVLCHMFDSCGYEKMTSLKLGDKFDPSYASDLGEMFKRCGYKNMETLDLGENFNTYGVMFTDSMFEECGYEKLTHLDLGDKFDTSTVTNMNDMFSRCGYESMETLNLGEKFNTENVEKMSGMFAYCGSKKMKSLDLGDQFDTSKVTDMSNMFSNCGEESLIRLDLGDKFDTSNVVNMNAMFYNCGVNALPTLDLGDQFDTGKVTDMTYMFCMFRDGKENALETLNLGAAFKNLASDSSKLSQMFRSLHEEVDIYVTPQLLAELETKSTAASLTVSGNQLHPVTVIDTSDFFAETYKAEEGETINFAPDLYSISQNSTVYYSDQKELSYKNYVEGSQTVPTYSQDGVYTVYYYIQPNSFAYAAVPNRGSFTFDISSTKLQPDPDPAPAPDPDPKPEKEVELAKEYKITLNAASIILQKGTSTKKVKATLSEGDTIVKYESSNPKIASVSDSGVIKGLKKGSATITYTTAHGATASLRVKVQSSVVKTKKIAVSNIVNKKVTLKKGEKLALETEVTPITTSDKLSYKTSNKTVVTVNKKGVLKAKKKGKATITVKSGKKTVKIKVTVK